MAKAKSSELDPILLHRGIGPLVFGCSRAEVIEALGPDHAERAAAEGDIHLCFPDLGLEFTFWADFGQRLGIIKTQRPSATLLGKQLLGNSESEVLRFIEAGLKEAVSDHDGCVHGDGSVQAWIEVDRLDLSFWFDDGSLQFIDWTCAWKDGDTPEWPRQSGQA